MQTRKETSQVTQNQTKTLSFKIVTKSTNQTDMLSKFLGWYTNLFNNIVVIAFDAVYLGFFGPILYWAQNVWFL